MDKNELKLAADKLLIKLSASGFDLESYLEYATAYLERTIEIVVAPNADKPDFKKRLEFEWSTRTKEVGILLRDIAFRLYRDLQFLEDGKLANEIISDRNHASRNVIEEAHNHLISLYESLESDAEQNRNEDKNWKHYHSPKDVFQKQMKALISQIKQIGEAHKVLQSDRSQVKQFYDTNEINQNKLKGDIAGLKTTVDLVISAVNAIGDVTDKANITGAKSSLKRVFEQVESIKNSYNAKKKTNNKFHSQNIPVEVHNGELIVREISVLGHIASWIEGNIYPSIFEAGRSIVLTCDNILVALINVQNRLNLSTSDQNNNAVFLKASILEPIRNIGIDPNQLYDEIHTSINYINEKFEENVVVSNVFEGDNPLFSDQSKFAINQYKLSTPKWLSSLPVHQVNKLSKKIYKQLLRPVDFDNNSAELIIYVDKKTIKSLDQYNHSLFLNKGFLGKSFIVERENINSQIRGNYNSWLAGFRGSFLLFGSRLSGKSTILESVFNTESDHDIIDLKPGKSITFQGRKHETECDLYSSLAFIDKYSYNKKVVLLIDDLELWRDRENSLFDNVKSLIEFMGKSYKRIFFMVATNQWLKEQLDNYLDFSNEFVSVLSTDNMPSKEIQKALLIRHGATISELIYQDDQQPGINYLQRQTMRVAENSRGNIGLSLFNWCRLSFSNYDFEVEFQEIPANLVNIIKDNYEVLLYIMRNNATSEAELSVELGSRFVKLIGPDIQKLISYKLLNRKTNGDILINEYLVSEIEAVMKYTSNKVSVYA